MKVKHFLLTAVVALSIFLLVGCDPVIKINIHQHEWSEYWVETKETTAEQAGEKNTHLYNLWSYRNCNSIRS